MTQPELPPGAIAQSDRGFPIFAEFDDLYHSHWKIQFSSRAFHPAVWVWIDGTAGDQGGVGRDGSGHLTIEQAKRVRDALSNWIACADELTERGVYWPEEDES